MKRIFTRKKAFGALVVVLVLSMAGVALAEVVTEEEVQINFHGSISPVKLPRTGAAPVGVQVGAKIKSLNDPLPPRLQEIVLDINKHGVINSKGLPTCPLGKLHNATDARVKKVCGGAEVGHGNVTARVKLREQGIFSIRGPLLAFNGIYKGKPAIFAHVTGKGKLSITYVIIFVIKKTAGNYGTSLVAQVPPIASGSGFISAFDLSLKRSFTSGGKKQSYVSAACPLPKGINIAEFNFAKSTYVFEDGTSLSSVLNRTCKAKG